MGAQMFKSVTHDVKTTRILSKMLAAIYLKVSSQRIHDLVTHL